MNINIQGLKRYRLYCFMWGYYKGRGHYQIEQVYKSLAQEMECRNGWKSLEEQLEKEQWKGKAARLTKQSKGEAK